jgi:hypothetical protein
MTCVFEVMIMNERSEARVSDFQGCSYNLQYRKGQLEALFHLVNLNDYLTSTPLNIPPHRPSLYTFMISWVLCSRLLSAEVVKGLRTRSQEIDYLHAITFSHNRGQTIERSCPSSFRIT